MGDLQPLHLLVILAIALLIFGPSKLPELGKGMGSAIRGFKEGLKDQPAAPKAGENSAASTEKKS